ncbi:MAG: flagellar basal body L-ring protein FlgH [Rhodospirillales bacterium]|nr:flagellar basal body L-ring protein FlgH [Rhodospirillales bacterium]
MTRHPAMQIVKIAALAGVIAAVAGCNTLTKLSEVGDGPKLSQIDNPTARPGYKPVSLPLPAAQPADHNPNSLWRPGAKAFFKDTRAKDVGDIMTVKLNLKDSASWDNKTERDRKDSEDTDVTSLLGYEGSLSKILPEAVNPASLLSFGNTHSTAGDGSIERSETLELTFAAIVTQILRNGHLVILGRQEVRVNAELRELMVTGVIRPEDIDSDNSIPHEKIAEMRVAYGGRGTLSNLQQPRWGTQIWDILFPF